jgi:outer membrane protein OmpA-like peptidoglycan-associated protein
MGWSDHPWIIDLPVGILVSAALVFVAVEQRQGQPPPPSSPSSDPEALTALVEALAVCRTCVLPETGQSTTNTVPSRTASEPATQPPTVAFEGVTFEAGNFEGVNFEGVKFERVNVEDLNLEGVNSEGVSRDGVVFTGGVRITVEESVLFATGSANVSPSATPLLEALATRLASEILDRDVVLVEGFVDEVGDEDFNRTLAADRADTVAAILVSGAPQLLDHIETVGHGEDDLLDPTCRGDCPPNRVVWITLAF